ncbi:MAG: NAD-dependent epimerase/dehydratase family protein [Bradyrhizobiaceae bacterium]|nr:NAD-dependent epimerase/dehydratase family protein [Bradyrhizobiaceae bacterium]
MSTIVITGASGEIGHSLIEAFHAIGGNRLIALDLNPLPDDLRAMVDESITADVASPAAVEQLEKFEVDEVYHLAALLSTSAERNPELAHHVNVNGTLGLLSMARRIGTKRGTPVKFLFPSTIAVYGLPSVDQKRVAGAITEDQYLQPTTMYGINKLYCEQVGAYMSDRYGQLSESAGTSGLDFRALRFPGLISATTVPSGGTSDYAPEMIHAAAQGKPYACFVRPDTQIPFMAMPDGVKALLALAQAPLQSLTRRTYNIGAFAPSAEAIAEYVCRAFPNAEVTYAPHAKRQAIVDSWCADVNDQAARADWGWTPDYDMNRAFEEYLVPTISSVYA